MDRTHCEECKTKFDGTNEVIRHSYGRIEVELDMVFCKRACEEKMIAHMLQNADLPHHVHHSAMERAPHLARQMNISCNLGDSCPDKKKKATPPPVQEAAPSDADAQEDASPQPERQDQIGSSVITKIKRSFSPKKYVASTGDASNDIVKRIQWYKQKGGIAANRQTIRNEGAQLRSGIVGQASKESGVDFRRVDAIFEQHSNDAMGKLEQSKEFFPVRTSNPQKPLVHTIHNDDVLTKEMFIILRRSLNPSARSLVNTAQLAEDLLRTYNKVVDATGADGYEFLKTFFYDAREAGISSDVNKRSK
jgi:hypothetical protein